MDGVIVALLIAVLAGQSITIAVPLFIHRNNNNKYRDVDSYSAGFVQSEAGGLVCVYHKDLAEKLDKIDSGVENLATTITELKTRQGEK